MNPQCWGPWWFRVVLQLVCDRKIFFAEKKQKKIQNGKIQNGKILPKWNFGCKRICGKTQQFLNKIWPCWQKHLNLWYSPWRASTEEHAFSIICGQNYYFWSKIPLWLNGQNIQHLPELFWPKFLAISPFDCALIKAVNHSSWKKNKHPKSLWRLIFHFHLMFLLCSLNALSNPVLVSSATGSLAFVIRFHISLYGLASWFRWW